MRAVIQRVTEALVRCQGPGEPWVETGRIERGLVVLLGIEPEDTDAEIEAFATKLLKLRVFPGRTPVDKNLAEVDGSVLAVSQFTLGASLQKGNRPSFDRAARPEIAEPLYDHFVAKLREAGVEVGTGRFGADMEVELCNDGPFTLIVYARDGRVIDL
ncbi:MAG: D-aminoacyl-tRNA deacylase [Planctomycetota bacterium]